MINPKTLITVDLLGVSVADLEFMSEGLSALRYYTTDYVNAEKMKSLAAWLNTLAAEAMEDGVPD